MKVLGAKLVLLALFVFPVALQGEEPALTTETLLTAWQRARQNTKVIDSRFVRLTNDRSLGTAVQEPGRFYWEADNRACYLLDEKAQMIWNGDFVLVDPVARTYLKCSPAQKTLARKRLRQFDAAHGWQRLLYCLELCEVSIASCEIDGLLPFCATIDANMVRDRYELTWKESGGKVTLTAVPKDSYESKRVREIGVILDRETFAVLAHRVVHQHGLEVVHVFERTAFDATAIDRARLFEPDLHGLRSSRLNEEVR